MRRDHKPYYIKKLQLGFRDWYVRHFLESQFTSLGKGYTFLSPWHVKVFGEPIEVGDHVNVISTPDKKVRLTVWSEKQGKGSIRIGRHCLICPGVRISAAMGITIGDDCMMASDVYITDADWHGIYDRLDYIGRNEPVTVGNNVWLGDGAIVCKGVTIGDNSIIGARAVVTRDIPANSIAAGNPATVIAGLDSSRPLRTRGDWFADPEDLALHIEEIDRDMLRGNTILGWLRALLFPTRKD